MYSYVIYGLNILSEISLPAIESHKNETQDYVKIHQGEVDLSPSQIRRENNIFIVTENGIYFYWNDLGSFKLSKGKEIIFEPVKDYDPVELKQFILGTGLSTIIHQRGDLVLHGSAINVKENAICFLGESGSGKSTITQFLYNKGYPAVVDDVIRINFFDGKIFILPGYPHLRIEDKNRGNSCFKKNFYPVGNGFETNPLPIKKTYILKTGQNLNISSLNAQKALMELIKHSRVNYLFDKEDKARNLRQCSELLKRVEVKLLHIQNDSNGSFELNPFLEDDMNGV